MDIVQDQAERYFKREFNSVSKTRLQNIKSNLETTLYDLFTRDKDKLKFLQILHRLTKDDLEEHMKTCVGCGYEKQRKIVLFAIEQEFEKINKDFYNDTKDEIKFTSEEVLLLNRKIDNALQDLREVKFGQQIIFDEFDELREHFDLGKKTWFQLLKGKVLDLVLRNILNKETASRVYNLLSQGFDSAIEMIEDNI